MPGGDNTGPRGEGPLTGRHMGSCSGNDRRYTGGAYGGRLNSRMGRGFGRGMGYGFNNEHRYSGTRQNPNQAGLDDLREEIVSLKGIMSALLKKLSKDEKES